MSRGTGFFALLAIGLHAFLAVHLARADRSASVGDASVGSRAWILGPGGATLETAGVAHVDRAVAHLSAEGSSEPGWYDAYRAELTTAQGLLSRSLRARPGEPQALARLAAVRWELEGPAAGGSGEDAAKMIALASRVAPGSAPVQILLGELLLRMARPAEASDRLRRAVELDPTLAARAVRAFLDQSFDPSAILEALRPTPAVLLVLQSAFFREGDPTAYVAAIEGTLPAGGASLIATYADSCLRLGMADRLLATVDGLAPFPAARDEAARLCARSQARLARSETAPALDDARSARALAPDDPRMIEQLGRAALAADDPAGAIEAFRDALAVAARRGARPAVRAGLYRMIGVAQERQGQPARAYDAYLKTLELDPADVHALRRVADMRRAAGFKTP